MAKGKSADTISEFNNLKRRIGSGEYAPVYLLHGSEPYFIDVISDLLEDVVLPEAERSFNLSVLYGKETKMQDLISMARRFPMMAKYQVIIVKEAQDLKEWDKLESYVTKPLESTVLVFCYRKSKFDMRLKVGKAMGKYEVFLSEPLKDYQLKTWIPDYFKSKERTIDPTAVERLIDLVGTELSVLHNEIDKLLITVKEQFIKMSHVDEHVGMNRTYNVFELQNALGHRNFNKAIQIAHHMSVRVERGELLAMTAVIYKFFSKVLQVHGMSSSNEYEIASALGVNSFFVRDYLQAARNYKVRDLENVFNQLKLLDLRVKGVHRGSAEDGELLVETVVKILKN